MLLMVGAALFAVSASSFTWYFIHTRESRRTVSNRMAVMPKAFSFPYTFDQNSPQSQSGEEGELTLDESYSSKLTRRLYLAGFRTKKHKTYFLLLKRFSYILPLFILFLGILSGTLSLSLLGRMVIIAGGFNYISYFLIRVRRSKIENDINRTLPQVLDLLTVSLEAGLNFSAALPRVLDELNPKDLLVKELRLMHQEYLGGLSFAAVCDRVSRRCEVPDLSIVMSAIAESESSGASLAHVLRIHSHELCDKHRQRLREKAHKLPVKLIFPMMLIFITIFTIALGPSVYRMKQQTLAFGKPEVKSPKAETK